MADSSTLPSNMPYPLLARIADEQIRRRTFLILDAGRGVNVPALARRYETPCGSLYSGRFGAMLSDVAPYLCQVETQSKLLHWFAEQWGQSVGVLVQTKLDFDATRSHLRSELLVAADASDRKYLLRFYDPRVLRDLLSKASRAGAEPFFGPIQAWHCENAGADHLLTFALQADGVFVRQQPVTG